MGNLLDPANNGVSDAFDKGFNPDRNGTNDLINTMKDVFTRTLDEVKRVPEDTTNMVGEKMKEEIWNPIDNALVKPSIEFFDTVRSYMNCTIDKIEHFWGCFIWYVIFLIQESLNIIIVGVLFALNQITQLDLLSVYFKFLDLWGYASDIFFDYTGYELLVFPYSDDINARCFVCDAGPARESKAKQLTNEIRQEIKDETKKFNSFVHGTADNISNYAGGK
jgi:hypothetical protein